MRVTGIGVKAVVTPNVSTRTKQPDRVIVAGMPVIINFVKQPEIDRGPELSFN